MSDHEIAQLMKYMRYIVLVLVVLLVAEVAAVFTSVMMAIQNMTLFTFI
jgi:hypothetical protein